MLTHLRLSHFKSWKHLELPCAPITGIFGTNSSGKTSILQFLLLLKQTKDATDRAVALELNGELVELGTSLDVLHRHDESHPLEWELSWSEDDEITLLDSSKAKRFVIASGAKIAIESSVRSERNAISSRRLSYSVGSKRFSLAPKDSESNYFDLSVQTIEGQGSEFSFLRNRGRPWQLPGPIKSYAFPDQARTYYQNAGFLADLEADYEEALDGIFYLGPLRERPKRDYLWARSRPSDVGTRGEKAIDAILAATEAGELRNLKYKGRRIPFQAMIAHWLQQMGLISEFRVEEIKEGSNRWQARVKTQASASEVFLTDVGFGVSQVLPVVTLLQYVPEGSTVMLEQPEIHLHPLAQAELAEVIIQAALHRRVQIIVESHSEHFLLRLQRRIADETVSVDKINLFFCDIFEGMSRLTPLELDMFGRIENWPAKFMGDAFQETAEAEMARLRRMRGAA